MSWELGLMLRKHFRSMYEYHTIITFKGNMCRVIIGLMHTNASCYVTYACKCIMLCDICIQMYHAMWLMNIL